MDEIYFHKIMKELCEEKDIKVESMSYGWILKLEKNDISKYMIRYAIGLNSNITSKIAKDKYATYEILSKDNIPVAKYHMIFNPKTRKEYVTISPYKRAKELYGEYNNKIIIKANEGSKGTRVYLCTTHKQIQKALRRLFKTCDTICVCPFYEYDIEYRSVYIDGEILITFGKQKPFVTGDGISNVKELMKKQNIILPENEASKIAKKEIRFQYIPKKDETYQFLWKHNLSSGANPIIIEQEQLIKRIQNIVKNAAKAIDLKTGTIDIMHTKDDELRVLEINSSICINEFAKKYENGEKIARDIYERMLYKMFESGQKGCPLVPEKESYYEARRIKE